MGLEYPLSIKDSVTAVVSFCNNPVPLLRERAVNALGRIGRGNYRLIEPYWQDLFRFASDEEASVRLIFIWTSENIATNTPDIYGNYAGIFVHVDSSKAYTPTQAICSHQFDMNTETIDLT